MTHPNDVPEPDSCSIGLATLALLLGLWFSAAILGGAVADHAARHGVEQAAPDEEGSR